MPFLLPHLSVYLYAVLLYLFFFCIVVQFVYAAFFFLGMAAIRRYPAPGIDAPPVSVIICAKNEANNLLQNLPSILQQQYHHPDGNPLFEVLVVNDQSQDDTEQVLSRLKQQYLHLHSIEIANSAPGGKKNALKTALGIARHHLLLFTDADCTPSGPLWLQEMTAPLSHGKEIVAGLGTYTNNYSLLQTFIHWETIHTFMQFAGYAGNGLPYMATGRNMACTRTAMEKAIQHPLWQQLQSGHDDLIVQAAANATNVAVVCNDDAYTISPPKATWREWAAQKQRHVSTGKYYRPLIKFMLALYAATHAASWLLVVALLIKDGWPAAALFLAPAVMPLSINAAARKIGPKIKLPTLFIGSLGWMIYNFAFLPYIAWKNKTSWK